MSALNIKKEALFFIILFLGIFLFAYIGWNGNAFLQNIKYEYFSGEPTGPILSFAAADGAGNASSSSSTDQVYVGQPPTAAVSSSSQASSSSASKAAPGYVLIIPKISVNAPIVLSTGNTTQDVLDGMEKGVALYPGSSMPGTTDGRSVILGHSSRASWYYGNYAYVFSLLHNLQTFDEFYIDYGNTRYTYTVFTTARLSPDETNATIAGPAAPGEVDLITCWPVGGASERTVVRGKLVGASQINQ